MAHIESVIAAILPEVEGILRRLGFVGSTGIADAVAVCPLQAPGQSLAEAPVYGRLQRIVVIGAAAGLVIDLREPGPKLKNRGSRTGRGIRGDANNPVGPRTQEKVA